MTKLTRKPATLIIALLGVLLLAVSLATGSSLGAFNASIANSANAAGSAALGYQHSYNSTSCTSTATLTATQCNKSLYPSGSSGSATDGIKNIGGFAAGSVSQSVSITTCGLVQGANTRTPADPMLARHATTLGGPGTGPLSASGAFTLDGSTAYLSDLNTTSTTLPTQTGSYGYGIWFKTTSTAGGALFGLVTNQTNTGSFLNMDRALYLDTTGHLWFVTNTLGAKIGPTSGAGYNDGVWHFAYVTTRFTGLQYVTSIYVDAGAAPAATTTNTTYAYDTGYWHLGWSPVNALATSVVSSNFFAGSLSNFFAVGATASTSLPANGSSFYGAANQGAFDSAVAAAGADLYWQLDDTVATPYTGGYPTATSTKPCAMVNIKWSFTNPTSCAVTPASTTVTCSNTSDLASAANGTWYSVGTPAPGATQSSVIALSRGSSYYANGAGMLIYAPISIRMVAGSWQALCTWTSAGSIFTL